jgi:hypothetical protein
MVFDPPVYHPNGKPRPFHPISLYLESLTINLPLLFAHNPSYPVYSNGEVCISILHTPGDDPLHYEKASERWSPVQGVRSVLMSVLSMLAEPNVESGANIEVSPVRVDWVIILKGERGLGR